MQGAGGTAPAHRPLPPKREAAPGSRRGRLEKESRAARGLPAAPSPRGEASQRVEASRGRMRAGSYPWQGGNPAPRVKRHGLRKELFISHKYSRFLRAGRFFNFFFPPICFLPFTEFALKIYTSLFSNQTRSAKEKNKTKKPNPYKTLKRPEREVRHSRTPAQRPRFPLSSATHCPPAPSPLSPFAAPKISQILSTCCKFPSSSRAGAQLAPKIHPGEGKQLLGSQTP